MYNGELYNDYDFLKNIVQSLFLNTWLQNMIMTMEVMLVGCSAAVYKMVQVSDMVTSALNLSVISGTNIHITTWEQRLKTK